LRWRDAIVFALFSFSPCLPLLCLRFDITDDTLAVADIFRRRLPLIFFHCFHTAHSAIIFFAFFAIFSYCFHAFHQMSLFFFSFLD